VVSIGTLSVRNLNIFIGPCVTVLLRRLPGSVTGAPRALEAALEAHYPG